MEGAPKKIGIIGAGQPFAGIATLRPRTDTPYKAKKEREQFEKVLLEKVNRLLTFKASKPDRALYEHTFRSINKEWIEFVCTWNADFKHMTVLRIGDFSNLLIYVEKKRKEEAENGTNKS
jgi:hypothetical protein